MFGPDRYPGTTIAREQSVGNVWPGAAGGIIGKIIGTIACPEIE